MHHSVIESLPAYHSAEGTRTYKMEIMPVHKVFTVGVDAHIGPELTGNPCFLRGTIRRGEDAQLFGFESYPLFSLHSRFLSFSRLSDFFTSCEAAALSPSTMAACNSSTAADKSRSISASASLLTGSL